jgi:hypothetical protein
VKAFEGARALRTHAFDLPVAQDAAFRFFEPEGERAWAPGWAPRYVYPSNGVAEKGMVFTTGDGDDLTIWIVLGHAPDVGAVEYARITPGQRLAIVRVHCSGIDKVMTRVTVSYEFTGLSEAGNAYVHSMDEASYRAFIESWSEAIRRAL